ncbi:hypothetical protein BC832DRAFT_543076 [Gaertneriomyces semiglobifer]|nr:hypothetical protein BC832DRAFT_543076 [Gaertneriomyces semiglobifer]
MKLDEITKDTDVHVASPVNGFALRKGSFLCTMMNSDIFNDLVEKDTPASDPAIQKILQDVEGFVPALANSGLFDFFTIPEWIDGAHPGRLMVLALYLGQHPELFTDDVKVALKPKYDEAGVTLKDAMKQALTAQQPIDWD